MAVLKSSFQPASPDAKANAAAWREIVGDLQEKRAEAALGGNERARERHVSRGKLLPRDRVMRLIDPGSPFLELSPLAAYGMYDEATPRRRAHHRHRPRRGPRVHDRRATIRPSRAAPITR
ncbi:MAG: hypothetical protein QM722_01135 [Piscinibacter sp.]